MDFGAQRRSPRLLRRRAQRPRRPDRRRPARHASGDEPGRGGDVRPRRARAGSGNRRVRELGPQELLLPGPAEELPDQPVRPAAVPRRHAVCRLRRRAAADPHDAGAPGRGRGQAHARAARRRAAPGGRARGRRVVRRPQPRRHAAAGDRQRTRREDRRRGRCLLRAAARAGASPRRHRGRDAARARPLRAQHQPGHPRRRRERVQDAHRRGEEPQQLQGGERSRSSTSTAGRSTSG